MADFKAASSAISNLKVGSTSVAKVYAGADLVWSAPSSGDWDTSGYSVAIAGTTADPTANTRRVLVSYSSSSGAFNSYAMSSGSTVDATTIGWSSSSAIDIDMSATINSSTFSAAYPYCAYWNDTDNQWQKGTADDRGAFKVDMIYGGMTGLLYNNMDDGTQAVLFYTSDPGSVSGWTAYDGPTSNTDWDTHQVGAALLPRLDTSTLNQDFDHQFPLDAAYQMPNVIRTNASATSPLNYAPQGVYASPANQVKAPPYIACWVSQETEDVGGYGCPGAGWYVYARNGYSDGTAEGGTPTSNGRAQYIAHAWKSGAGNDDGYMGTGGPDNFPFFWAALDDYSGSTGSGGTDSWTDPFDWSSPNYTATMTITAAGSNFTLSNVSESGATADWQPYTYQPLRGGPNQVFILWKASSGGAFNGSGNDFFADTKLQHARLRNTTSGSEYDIWATATASAADQYTKLTYGDSSQNEPWGSGPTFYLRWAYNTGDGTSTYAKFSDGDTIQLDLFYTDDT